MQHCSHCASLRHWQSLAPATATLHQACTGGDGGVAQDSALAAHGDGARAASAAIAVQRGGISAALLAGGSAAVAGDADVAALAPGVSPGAAGREREKKRWKPGRAAR